MMSNIQVIGVLEGDKVTEEAKRKFYKSICHFFPVSDQEKAVL